MKRLILLLAVSSGLWPASVIAEDLRNTIVTIQVTKQNYEQARPWQKSSPAFSNSHGFVLPGQHILTEAGVLRDAVYVRVQKRGGDLNFEGRIVWRDYMSNLGLIEVPDKEFWKDMKPLNLQFGALKSRKVRTARWHGSELRSEEGTVIKYEPATSKYKRVMYPMLTAEFKDGIDGGLPVLGDSGAIGMVSHSAKSKSKIIPAYLIDEVMKERSSGKTIGFSRLGVYYQGMSNTTLAAHLGLTGKARGVYIREVLPKSTAQGYLKAGDILLSLRGFAIDPAGDVYIAHHGTIPFGAVINLAGHRGRPIKAEVFRDGKVQTIELPFRQFRYEDEMVPLYRFDQQPRFVVRGGFLFSELSVEFLRLWDNWWKKAPAQMRRLVEVKPPAGHPDHRIVIIAGILTDPYNQGYGDARFNIVSRINGKEIHGISDVATAFGSPQDGFHVIEFETPPKQRVVLDAENFEAASKRIESLYQIPQTENLE